MAKKDLPAFLQEEFQKRHATNSRYSLRAFANSLDLSPATLSQILSGKRAVTKKTVLKIAKNLDLTSRQTLQLGRSVLPREILEQDPGNDEHFDMLADDQFALVSDWQHYAILSLGWLKQNQSTPTWVAKRLAISNTQAAEGLSRLERLKLIEIKPDGSFVRTAKPITTQTDIPSEAVKKYHRQILELAKEKLDKIPVAKREYNTVTMAIDPSLLSTAKEMMKQFRRDLSTELERGDQREVYALALQLFPLTTESKS